MHGRPKRTPPQLTALRGRNEDTDHDITNEQDEVPAKAVLPGTQGGSVAQQRRYGQRPTDIRVHENITNTRSTGRRWTAAEPVGKAWHMITLIQTGAVGLALKSKGRHNFPGAARYRKLSAGRGNKSRLIAN